MDDVQIELGYFFAWVIYHESVSGKLQLQVDIFVDSAWKLICSISFGKYCYPDRVVKCKIYGRSPKLLELWGNYFVLMALGG